MSNLFIDEGEKIQVTGTFVKMEELYPFCGRVCVKSNNKKSYYWAFDTIWQRFKNLEAGDAVEMEAKIGFSKGRRVKKISKLNFIKDDIKLVTKPKKRNIVQEYKQIKSTPVNVSAEEKTNIVYGKITSTNNHMEAAPKGYTSFTFKPMGDRKVWYCLANNDLVESKFFYKSSNVKMELLFEERELKQYTTEHKTVKVLSLWAD